jgi:protein-disulfide isomerase
MLRTSLLLAVFLVASCQPTRPTPNPTPSTQSLDSLELTPPGGGLSVPVDLALSPTMGASAPKVTVVEFSNFRCRPCGEMSNSIHALAKEHPNDLRLIFKHGLLGEATYSYEVHEAAQTANAQGKFWEYAEVLFSKQMAFSNQQLRAYTQLSGVDPLLWGKDMAKQKYRAVIERDFYEADLLQHKGTPVIYINGMGYFGLPKEQIVAKIKEALGS